MGRHRRRRADALPPRRGGAHRARRRSRNVDRRRTRRRNIRPLPDRAGRPPAWLPQFRHRDASHPRGAGVAGIRGHDGTGGGDDAAVGRGITSRDYFYSDQKSACRQLVRLIGRPQHPGVSMPLTLRKTEIIRKLFAAYLANDRKAVEATFTDDFRFTSPYDDEIDKPTYFERCWRVPDWIERQDLETIMAEGEAAFVTYRCVAKDGKSFLPSSLLSQASGSGVSTSISARPIETASSSKRSRSRARASFQNNSPGHVGAAKAGSSY